MREPLRQPTLNAVKAFEATARLGSLKAAAAALGVTASAVSHQVRQLEQEIGKRLFNRRNNAIELTPEGYRLFEEVGPALRVIARATDAIRMDTQVVALNVTTSFAQRWLIPRLADFQKRHPRIGIEMATVRRPIVLDDSVEMTIAFFEHGPPVSGAVELVKDFARPMAAAGLSHDKSGRARHIRAVPLLTSNDGLDWRIWATENNMEFAELRIAYRFDTDASVIAACSAGLGVALIPTEIGRREIESGLLVPFGDFRELCFGGYWLATAPRLRRAAQIFVNWLLKVAPGIQPDYSGRVAPALNGVKARAESENDGRADTR
jgi:LysR family transcriptional regulator, glycine cleavage system transcriptional activator